MRSSYNLNNLIQIVIDGPWPYVDYFDNEYQRISHPSAGKDTPVVRLTVVDRISSGPVREKLFKNLFRFRYLVRDLDTPNPEIVFERHWLDRLYLSPLGAFIQGQLLEPLTYAKLLECDVLFMHAAGVSREGKAYVFPAHGGTGKTTLALSLARQGFDLMGDDLLMVDLRSGTVHPYARPLHLFTYNLKTLRVPIRLHAAIRIKDLLRSGLYLFTGQRFLIATRAHVDELLQVHFGKPSKLARIIFLRREGTGETIKLDTPETRRRAAQAIIESADLNDSLQENIVDDSAIWQREIDVVMRVLEHVPEIEFINSRAMVEADRQRLAAKLDSLQPA